MTHNPPKRASKPIPDRISLVVRRHVQRRLGLQMKTEMMNGKIIFLQTMISTG